jgi:phosphoribosylformimino-5-aminoimidazole carboxamide ribonucleotide (ProFAR) isomerase
MDVFPAIDLLGGKAVRLVRGRKGDATAYSEDPAEIAGIFFKNGARFVHVVDLDAAFGTGNSLPLVEKICALGKVQLGGGIRSPKDAAKAGKTGANRLVVATALSTPGLVDAIKDEFGGEVFAALDFSKDCCLLKNGWQKESDAEIPPDVDGIIATSAQKDGTMEGPELGLFEKVGRFGCEKGYAGGISCEGDLETLEQQGWDFAIVGKAFYEGKLPLGTLKKWF